MKKVPFVTKDQIEGIATDVYKRQIQSCDIRWISMFERMVGILPDPLASIEERRRRVLEKWRAAAPYNYAGLIRQLNGLCLSLIHIWQKLLNRQHRTQQMHQSLPECVLER